MKNFVVELELDNGLTVSLLKNAHTADEAVTLALNTLADIQEEMPRYTFRAVNYVDINWTPHDNTPAR